MKLSFFGLKASTVCVGGSLLLMGGFMSVNLAGCGGGGGGGGGVTSTRVTAIIRLIQQSGDPAVNATLRLLRNGREVVAVQADDAGLATLSRISPGTYTYELTLEGETEPSTGTVTILALNGQSYTLTEGSNNNFKYSVSGTVFLNPSGVDDPDGNDNTPNCTTSSDPVSAPITIYVRDLNVSLGQPIIAQFSRGISDTGGYTITLPYRPSAFQVEVTQASGEGDQYAGISPQTAFPTNTTALTGINICANASDTVPVSSTLTPTATPSPTATP